MSLYDSTGESFFDGVLPPPRPDRAPAVADLQPSLTTWVDRADALDEFHLALALQGSQAEPSVLIRARALLSSGDPAGAYRALGVDSDALPALGAPFTKQDMLVAACRASMGDNDAHRWLLHSGALVLDQQIGWYAAHLVAVVSDLRGETEAADRAWRLLAEKYAVSTPHVMGRVVAAHVWDRHGEDGPAVTRRLAEASTSLERLAHTVAADPRPTLAAVNTLLARHDAAGARLLLEFVTRRNEVNPAITARLRDITPERQMSRYRSLVIAGFALVPFAFLLGGVGVIMVLAGAWLFRHYVNVPGLSAPDSFAWRAARQLRLDPKTGLATSGRPDGSWIALAMLVGGVVGTVIGALLMPLVQPLGEWATVGAWLGPVVLSVVFAHQAASRWSRARQQRARRMTRTEATRKHTASVGACQCWDTGALADEVAQAYAQRHLVDAGFDLVAAAMGRALGRRVRLLRCPSLGTTWVLAGLTAEGAAVLLRGASETATPDSHTEVGQYL